MPDDANSNELARCRRRRLEQLIVIVFSLVVTLPYCNKAFHIDDPLYLSIARQILVEPLRPFDGWINWQHVTEPAWRVSISPPGYSYWLAAWMAVGVTTESGLHLVGSFWVMVLGLATYAWASRLGDWPLTATLIILSSPIAIAGQNLMLDIPMLALAASSLATYQRANDRDSILLSLLAGLLAGLSVNVKYAGIVAVGVMIVDAILWRRWRLLPGAMAGIVCLILGQLTVAYRDGTPQLLFARQWITQLWPSDASDMLHRTVTSAVYLGASAAWFLLLCGVAVRGGVWRWWAMGGAVVVAVAAVIDLRWHEPSADFCAIAQAAFFAWNGGLVLCWLVVQLLRTARTNGWHSLVEAWFQQRNAGPWRHAIMLAVWTIGFWYLGTLNGPFVAPRAMLPCVSSVVLATLAIMPAREQIGRMVTHASIVLTLFAGLLVGASDYRWAGIYRDYATRLAEKYRPPSGRLYFLGHWGWQHYAQAAGMVQFDPVRSRLAVGDVMVWPRNVDYPTPVALILQGGREIAREQVPATRWLPRTRSPEGLIFLHGDTDRGRIPWGWTDRPSPQEVFFIFRFGE